MHCEDIKNALALYSDGLLEPATRDLCDRHIAPHAADVDERVRYPD